MLRNLHIQNYALIEALDLDFTEGFSYTLQISSCILSFHPRDSSSFSHPQV